MAELNHFRTYEIAQTEDGAPLELARDGEHVVCLGFDIVRRRFVEIFALSSGDGERFLERAASVAAQPHPSLAPIVDYGSEEGVHYFTADLVDGEPLASYTRRVRAVPPEAALAWLRQIAEGAAVLAEYGLEGDIANTRLAIGDSGRIVARITDYGITKDGEPGRGFGGSLAESLLALTNYQGPDEEPVYPPEVGPVCAALQAEPGAAGCLQVLADCGAAAAAPPLGESMRPRLLLEREMFRRARPEHVLPDRFRPLRRAGGASPYDSIVEVAGSGGEAGARARVLVLPPERFVSEQLLDIFESPACEEVVRVGSFWKHEDFRLLAEELHPGFSLGDWIAARPARPCAEIVSLLDASAAALSRLAGAGVRPRELHPDDVLIEFSDLDEGEVGALVRDLPRSRWPEHTIKVRTHPTLRSLTKVGDGAIPDGAEEVLEAARRGDPLPPCEVFAWYCNLRNRGLAYQASELVESLREVSALAPVAATTPAAVPERQGQVEVWQADPGAEEEDDDFEVTFSPIAAAMGLVEDDAEDEFDEEDESFTNPIARRVALGIPTIEEDDEEELEETGAPETAGVPSGAPELEEDEGPEELESPFGGPDDDGEPEGWVSPFAGTEPEEEAAAPREIGALLGEGPVQERRGSGANVLLLLFILITAIAIAAAVAHLTGRAFWLEQ